MGNLMRELLLMLFDVLMFSKRGGYYLLFVLWQPTRARVQDREIKNEANRTFDLKKRLVTVA